MGRDDVTAGEALLGQARKEQKKSLGLADGYKSAVAMTVEIKRLKNNEVHAELLLKDYFRGHTRKPESEELLARGIALEERGRLHDACKLYERVLFSEPSNLELRQYIAGIVSKINLELSTEAKQQHMQDSGYGQGGGRMPGPTARGATPQPWAGAGGGRGSAGVPLGQGGDMVHLMGAVDRGEMGRPRRGQGHVTPMGKEEYKAELAQQALEDRRRRDKAKVAEALLEKKQVEVNEIRHNLEKYNAQVGVGNDKIAQNLNLAQDRQEFHDRRRMAYEQERADVLSHVPVRGVFAGDGERQRLIQQKAQQLQWQQQDLQQAQQQQQHQQHQQQGYGAGYNMWVAEEARHGAARPYSGNIGTYGRSGLATPSAWQPMAPVATPTAQQKKDAAEAARQARYPGIRPKSAQPRSTLAAYEPPFQRPTVEKPAQKLVPRDVHARQEAWAAKREPRAKAAAAPQVSPHNHRRPGDGMPMRAEQVVEQIRKAGAYGEAARRKAVPTWGKS